MYKALYNLLNKLYRDNYKMDTDQSDCYGLM